MVARCKQRSRPTTWPAGAAHPCWDHPTGHGLRGERLRSIGMQSPLSPEPAKSLVPQSPGGLGAAPFRACTRAAVSGCRRTVQRGLPRRTTAHTHIFAVCGAAAHPGSVRRLFAADPKAKTSTGEATCITEM